MIYFLIFAIILIFIVIMATLVFYNQNQYKNNLSDKPKIQSSLTWINVKEFKPKNNQKCIVQIKNCNENSVFLVCSFNVKSKKWNLPKKYISNYFVWQWCVLPNIKNDIWTNIEEFKPFKFGWHAVLGYNINDDKKTLLNKITFYNSKDIKPLNNFVITHFISLND
jgi:hypothetical protein